MTHYYHCFRCGVTAKIEVKKTKCSQCGRTKEKIIRSALVKIIKFPEKVLCSGCKKWGYDIFMKKLSPNEPIIFLKWNRFSRRYHSAIHCPNSNKCLKIKNPTFVKVSKECGDCFQTHLQRASRGLPEPPGVVDGIPAEYRPYSLPLPAGTKLARSKRE